MSHAVRRTSRCVCVGVGLALTAATASAQSDAETLAELRECAAIEIDRARWNCFDGVLARAPRAVTGSEPGTARASASAGATAAAATAATDAATAALAPAATDAAPVSAAAEPVAPESARQAQRERAEQDDGSRIVTIVNMITLGRGNLRFVTDEGEIYTQPVGEPFGRYPDVPFEARIDTGPMLNHFIRPIESGPRTRVRLED